jgi:mannose-6-phosphate isomerase-like protein (cupin superfamily)
MIAGFSTASVADARAFRIAPDDSNYLVMLFEPSRDSVTNVYVVEIFTVGGKTPPNAHSTAHEFFYVISGEGIARCNGHDVVVGQGSALLLQPGHEHVVVNTGPGKLYTMTVMTPNEGFAELILKGTPVELDDEDRHVLQGSAGGVARS